MALALASSFLVLASSLVAWALVSSQSRPWPWLHHSWPGPWSQFSHGLGLSLVIPGLGLITRGLGLGLNSVMALALASSLLTLASSLVALVLVSIQ